MQVVPKASRDSMVSVSTKTESSSAPVKPSNTLQVAPGSIGEQGAPTTPPAPSQPAQDDRLEQMARRERMHQKQVAEFKAERAAFEASKASQPAGMTKDQFIAEFRKDPTGLGMSYDEIGQLYLAQGDPGQQKVRQLEAKIAELESKQTQALSAAEQQQKDAYAKALKQIEHEATSLVSTNDAYEVTRAMKSEAAIVALIEDTYREDGVLLKVEDAAAQVEAYLEKQALELVQLNKIRSKTQPSVAEPSTATQSTQIPGQKPPTTITRSLAQTTSGPSTAKERRERAIAIMEGRLKP